MQLKAVPKGTFVVSACCVCGVCPLPTLFLPSFHLWALMGGGFGSHLWLCPLTLLSVALSLFLAVEDLFCSLQVLFRVACITCSCCLGVYIGGHHSDLLFLHLPKTSSFVFNFFSGMYNLLFNQP